MNPSNPKNDLLTAFLELCDPFRQTLSRLPSEDAWHYISKLAKLHGVAPFFFYRTVFQTKRPCDVKPGKPDSPDSPLQSSPSALFCAVEPEKPKKPDKPEKPDSPLRSSTSLCDLEPEKLKKPEKPEKPILLPECVRTEWLGSYLFQLAEDRKARQQIKDLGRILGAAGIPFILLKGASAMMRLYPEPGLRAFCDLDILIPPDKVPSFKAAMAAAGYKPLDARNSPEDEILQSQYGHLDPFIKEDHLMVEAHLNLVGARGRQAVMLSEVWDDREQSNLEGVKVFHLGKEHFLIHTLLHSVKHLSDEGVTSVKWFIDALFSARTWKIDWQKFEVTALKWGVDTEIFPAVAALNCYWQVEVPLAEQAAPIDLPAVVSGIANQQKEAYSRLPAGYAMRIWHAIKLPDMKSRIRYLHHLLLPARKNLRWRYAIPAERSCVPYYFWHFLATWRKFFTGVWYLLSYRRGNVSP